MPDLTGSESMGDFTEIQEGPEVMNGGSEPWPAGTLYEVFDEKPLGVQWARGRGNRVYAKAVASGADPQIQEGDMITKVSASFGAEVWDAQNYGQVMYAIRTRIGQVYLQMEANGGDLSCFDPPEDDDKAAMVGERNSGNYGIGTKELQEKNYIQKLESERGRSEIFNDALAKFNAGEYREALIEFENVKGLEPENYIGDDFSRVTGTFVVSCYNIACCHAALNEPQAGLEALREALNAGFEDFDKCRNDPNLAGVRDASPDAFKAVMDQFDEPIFNEDVVNAIKGLFSFGKK